MSIKDRIVRLLTVVIAAFFGCVVMIRCANIGSPSGGPTDTMPPRIVAIEPLNNQTNMDTILRRIYIEFDEFVKVVDQTTNFYSSPEMKNKPQMEIRGRGIVITLRDTLKDNTTYALNFGSAIQDNNEGNPLTSFRYVFSTGDSIDSMMMSGYTEDGYKADSLPSAFIFLYPKDSVRLDQGYDSTLFNQRPSVIGRSEANGTFFVQNLKPIPYYVYAIDDTNNNMTYEPGTDNVGFLDTTFNPAEGSEFMIWYDTVRKYVVASPQILLRLFTDQTFKRQILSDQKRDQQHRAMLYFGAPNPDIDSIIFDSIPRDRVIIEHMSSNRDTIALWFDVESAMLPDTIRGSIFHYKHDSVGDYVQSVDRLRLSWRYIESKAEQQEREKQEREKKKAEESGEEWVPPVVKNPFKMNISAADKINPEQPIIFDFDFPLKEVNSEAIILDYTAAPPKADRRNAMRSPGAVTEEVQEEDKPRIKQPFTFERDTMNLRKWYLRADSWAEGGSKYRLTIPAATFTDLLGQQNDSISKEFTPYIAAEYSTVVVNMRGSKERPSHYVLELINKGKVIERKVGVGSEKVQFNYVPEGEVELRIIEDRNNNGEWDSGNLIERRQPEKSAMFTQDGESKIITKVNWEIELTVDATPLFRDETPEELAARLVERDKRMLEEREKKRMQKK
ncbi:MAG: Ig-like domain-containing protein [Rikenellaceae bacterium]